jgi:hypothetical protein
MPWVAFSAPFDWKPKPSVTIAFRNGDVKLVTTACANAAEAKGKGKRTKKPESERRNGSTSGGRATS